MKHSLLSYLLIIAGAALLFVPFLGHVHLFDWDEINFAECAREMIVSKDYLRMQIDFQPFYEKPPLFIWMQVLSMKLFGINEFAARFPNAMIGIATLCSLFHIGKRVVNERMAQWWVLLYAATWLPHFYFKSGIIDPTFNFFLFVAFFQVHLLRFGARKILHAVLAGFFIGLAVLTKGPVAILVAVLSFGVYMILNKGLWGYKIGHLLLIAGIALLTTGTWFGIEIITHGWQFFREFIAYQAGLFNQNIADHEEPWYYHPIVLLIGCFPASLFLFQFTRKRVSANEPTKDFTRWMWILFWVVLILFSIVKTKIVHYSSLCYFPLTFLAALQLYRLENGYEKTKKIVVVLLLSIGSLIGLAITLLPLVGIHKDKLIPLIADPFAVGNLQANVSWSLAECIPGLVYLVAIWVCVLLFKKDFRRSMLALCAVQVVTIQITVLHFTPKIEAYSQRAAIEFFESLKDKEVYVLPLNYKSYAHLFYSNKTRPANSNFYTAQTTHYKNGITSVFYIANEQWLLHGAVDRPTYFICKVQDATPYRNMNDLQVLDTRNGFVFFKRK